MMIFCYGTFAKVLNLCRPGKRNPSQKELQNQLLSSVYDAYLSAGITDCVSTDLLKCRQGLSHEVVSAARTVLRSGREQEVAVYFRKKILEAGMIKSDEQTASRIMAALLDLIRNDNTISAHTTVDLVNQKSKKTLMSQDRFVFPDFLAGVFLYAVTAVDNRKGKTFCKNIDDVYMEQFTDTGLKIVMDAQGLTKDEKALNRLIQECNQVLREAQNKVRVYSWDELNFDTVYVLPQLKQNMDVIFSHNSPFTELAAELSKSIPGIGYIKNNRVFKALPPATKLISASDYIQHINENPLLFIGDFGRAPQVSNLTKYLTEPDECKQEFYISLRRSTIGHLLEDDQIVYIVGGAGYGKSLFLKNLMVNPGILDGFNENPLLIIHGDIKRMIRTDGTFRTMTEYLEECFTNGSLRKPDELYPEFLTKCLEEGKCLILLDALDEVGNDQRSELHNLIVSYFEKTKNKVCITSRERGFIPRKHITCYSIQPVTIEDISEYVDRFIALNKFNTEEKERFLEQASVLVEKGFIKGFLTLSLLLAIYKNEEDLPSNKVLLYEKCFEYMANTREKNKKLMSNSSTGEEYNWTVLAKLMNDATFMELARLGTPNNCDIPWHKINDAILSLYEKRFQSSTECRMAAEMFLQFCADRTEVFVPSPDSNTDYRFFHRSFYEFFYAKYIELHTSEPTETYQSLCLFDVDSEIFELLIALYERRNPCYLRKFVLYMFSCAEKFLLKNEEKFQKSLDLLVLVMQNVEETDLIEQFITLFLEKGRLISRHSLSVTFGLISNPIRQNIDFFSKAFDKNDLMTTIEEELISFFLKNKSYCKNISRQEQLPKTVDDIKAGTTYACAKLLLLFPNTYERMDKCFQKLANKPHVLCERKMRGPSVVELVNFAGKIYKLPSKRRIQVYNTILANIQIR